MKVAVAVDGKIVSQHFGHCEGFEIFHIKDKKISNRIFLKNPGHRPGFLPKFLSEKAVDLVISGGMGSTAQMLFNQNGVEVITGARGNVDDVIDSFINGQLESTDEVCDKHEHSEECGK
ncbi:NifB/NifX family molybdenum-iron cluster-binding protein [Thermohalobacter berrensis]|uniref:Dinitrogenase iron-molybdenum cofactor n=1 Tax=Thermohalobacter berrensis TaxID=99594 RepID=A0A419T9W8_9FIRM|nr:NifB/NifX family molybdenum-iron cluster-binding protein [Thermohalobacter berrensis]RKD34263.1 dinitrogenase iron-molybdenum cofactor [Thermohalobacter berrensis]